MFKKNILAASMALAFGAGAPLTSEALTLSPGGTGDALVAPLFVTQGQWETRLQLINTDVTRSVVAKVAFWKADDSAEVLDFFVYLSPGDMWEGTVTVGTQDGTSVITSTDSSVLAAPGVFASEAQPFQATFPAQAGYVTVIESASFDLGPPPVPHATIKASHDAVEGQPVQPPVAPINSLTGVDILENPANGLQLSQQMEAFNDCDVAAHLTLQRVTTFTGNCTGTAGQIEGAMAKKQVAVPYEWGPGGLPETVALFTFPTKDELVPVPTDHPEILAAKGGADISGITFTLNIWDMDENRKAGAVPIVSPFPLVGPGTMFNEAEVRFMSGEIADPNFTKGWAEFLFNANGNSYQGVPVIPSYIFWEAQGNALRGYWERAASF